MKKHYVVSWKIENKKTGQIFFRKELCTSFSSPNYDPGINFTESISKDHPDSKVSLIRLKELEEDQFNTVIDILGADLLEIELD